VKRTSGFRADQSVGEFLAELNDLVLRGEVAARPSEPPAAPIFFILGAPRSGTTLLLQWLASIGFGYPSNLAARFWQAPYFAGMLQRLLSDKQLDFRDELVMPVDGAFTSNYGKTSGPLSPHEFSFFIRRFIPVTVGERLSAEQRRSADVGSFIHELNLFASALGSPVAMKGLLLQYELDLFKDFPQVFFIHVYRDEVDNICSLLRHREIVAGDRNEWISVRPPEYDTLKELSAEEQVAGQVHFTNKWIKRQLTAISPERVISVAHEEFCRDPGLLWKQLVRRLDCADFSWREDNKGPSKFQVSTYDSDQGLRESASAALSSVCRLVDTSAR
jgi:hypothetical protein